MFTYIYNQRRHAWLFILTISVDMHGPGSTQGKDAPFLSNFFFILFYTIFFPFPIENAILGIFFTPAFFWLKGIV